MVSQPPYTEGWPQTWTFVTDEGEKPIRLVPFSDAERMREAIQWALDVWEEGYSLAVVRDRLRDSLTPGNKG